MGKITGIENPFFEATSNCGYYLLSSRFDHCKELVSSLTRCDKLIVQCGGKSLNFCTQPTMLFNLNLANLHASSSSSFALLFKDLVGLFSFRFYRSPATSKPIDHQNVVLSKIESIGRWGSVGSRSSSILGLCYVSSQHR